MKCAINSLKSSKIAFYCSPVAHMILLLYKRDGELHNVRDVKGGVKVIQRHANSRDVGGDRDERFAPMKSE